MWCLSSIFGLCDCGYMQSLAYMEIGLWNTHCLADLFWLDLENVWMTQLIARWDSTLLMAPSTSRIFQNQHGCDKLAMFNSGSYLACVFKDVKSSLIFFGDFCFQKLWIQYVRRRKSNVVGHPYCHPSPFGLVIFEGDYSDCNSLIKHNIHSRWLVKNIIYGLQTLASYDKRLPVFIQAE